MRATRRASGARGRAGKDVRGLLRVHQFVKVEQYVLCEADEAVSADWHAKLLALAESLLAPEIPYRSRPRPAIWGSANFA